MPSAGGFLAAIASAVCNGSFGSLSKLPSVQRNEVPSPIFNFWVSSGIILSSIPVYALDPQVLPSPGFYRLQHTDLQQAWSSV